MAKRERKKTTPRTGIVYLDTAKLRFLLGHRGESWKSAGGVSPGTWTNLSNDKGVFPNTAKRVADYLGRPLEELVRPEVGDVSNDTFQWPQHPEWGEVKGTRSGWEYTSNGLAFFRCQVRHSFLGDAEHPVVGRARFYDLTGVAEDVRDEMHESLTRHAAICHKLGDCPQLVNNKSVLPVAGESFWWVVDEWFDARSLHDIVSDGPVPPDRLKRIMRQMLDGLEALHTQKIILRELAPRRVLVTDDDSVRLTDLDLAKLLLRGKTVSSEWPVDPYRAPEVESGRATPQADYYSWGVILLHAVTGDFTITCHDGERLDQLDVPQSLRLVLKKCIAPMPSKRPRSLKEIRKGIETW